MNTRGGDTVDAPAVAFRVRPLVTADLPAVFRIERDSYAPDLRESEAAVLSKMALFRAGALGCFDADQLCGYAFALPWRADSVIAVGEVIAALPERPDVMYIHDLVVAPGRRRQRVASTLLAQIVRLAEAVHLDRFALVAVQESEPFWRRMGFVASGTCEYAPGVHATRMQMATPAR